MDYFELPEELPTAYETMIGGVIRIAIKSPEPISSASRRVTRQRLEGNMLEPGQHGYLYLDGGLWHVGDENGNRLGRSSDDYREAIRMWDNAAY